MDINRLISLNRYTRKDIYDLTGKIIDKPTVVFVGNTVAERTVKMAIKSKKSVVIVGEPCSGKYTLAMKVCDELNLHHMDSFDGSDFEDLPYIRDDWIYITRNPPTSKTITQYKDSNAVFITLIDEGENYIKQFLKLGKVVKLYPPTHYDKEEFKKLTGYPMLINSKRKGERDETIIMKHIKKGNIFPLPRETHRWLMFNLDNSNVMAICTLASHFIDDPILYYAILKLIKVKQLLTLRRPIWVMKN